MRTWDEGNRNLGKRLRITILSDRSAESYRITLQPYKFSNNLYLERYLTSISIGCA